MYKVEKDRKAAKECTTRPHASELEAAVARSTYEAAEGALKQAAASVSSMLQELRHAHLPHHLDGHRLAPLPISPRQLHLMSCCALEAAYSPALLASRHRTCSCYGVLGASRNCDDVRMSPGPCPKPGMGHM